MLLILNDDLFLAINAPSVPGPITLAFAISAASWLICLAVALVPGL